MQKILQKRVLRDLKENFPRYIALGALIILSMYIVVSLVGAAETIINGTKDEAEIHKLEDGEFGVFVPLSEEEEEQLTREGIQLERMFYLDYTVADSGTIRIFQNRERINRIVIDEGRQAEETGEIALEKRYCEENGYEIGDTIILAEQKLTVVGIGSTPDYEACYESLGDSSIDSKAFGTGFVTKKEYQVLQDTGSSILSEQYQYAYRLNDAMTDEELKKKLEKYSVNPEEVEAAYFREYWDRTAGKVEDFTDGIEELSDGMEELTDGLAELKAHNDDLSEGAAKLLDAYLQSASESLKEYGLSKELTEENFEEILTLLKSKSDNPFLRMKLNSVMEELSQLKEYKDGVNTYTDGVAEAADGSVELSEGTEELSDATEEIEDELGIELKNLTFFLKAADNPRIGAGADDQVINKVAGLAAGVILMVLFTYVISVFVIHRIQKESSVIGALYALGVTRKDLMLHYLMLPVLVTFLSGVAGTLLGFSRIGIRYQMGDCYGYFSLPELNAVYSPYLLIYGMVMPAVVAVVVNCLVIQKHLSRPVLALMKKEEKSGRVSNLNLGSMGFIQRFRICQMLREARTGFTVLFGMFISLLIMMLGIDCYVMCQHISTENKADTRYEYMYTYKYRTEEVPGGGEASYAETLKKEIYGYNLDVTLLGIDEDNPYFDVETRDAKNEVVISSAMAQKYQLKKRKRRV